jgi:hypothetical protein
MGPRAAPLRCHVLSGEQLMLDADCICGSCLAVAHCEHGEVSMCGLPAQSRHALWYTNYHQVQWGSQSSSIRLMTAYIWAAHACSASCLPQLHSTCLNCTQCGFVGLAGCQGTVFDRTCWRDHRCAKTCCPCCARAHTLIGLPESSSTRLVWHLARPGLCMYIFHVFLQMLPAHEGGTPRYDCA